MNYKFLKWFDKFGNNLNFDYDENLDLWTGKIYFPKVSTKLYENQHLFILEQVLSGSPEELTYGFPTLGNQTPAEEAWGTKWEDNTAKDQIFTYLIEESDDGTPFIARYEDITYDNAPVTYTYGSPIAQKVVPGIESSALKINIAFSSDDEEIYERTLIIEDRSYSTPKTVAKIYFYGESIGEDERYRLQLENFGRRLDLRDALMVREYDINEALPDWEVINEKRKEMLMAGEEIFPYIGSYRGLVNIIKLFGYHDLRIKEYWLNIDQRSEYYGKTRQIQINGLLTNENSPFLKHPVIPTTTWRKKGEFGLFYDITVETGDVDQFGTPETENASQFTPEEVLIKLFAFKEKLQRDFLPVNAKIVDIVGEGIYFARYGIRSWADVLKVISQNVAINVDFDSSPTVGYIKDLRRFQIQPYSPPAFEDLPDNRFTNEINPYTVGQQYPPHTIQGLIDSIETFYDELSTFTFPYNDEKESYLGDEPGILAGCPIVLTADISQFTWDDLNVSWDNLPTNFTWDNIDFSNFYEIAWTIEKGGAHPYHFTFRGPIGTYYQLPHFLPYIGKYKVTMEVFDLFNARSIEIKVDYIEVQAHEIEIAAFSRWRDYEVYKWGTTGDTWDDLGGSSWHFPIEAAQPYNSPINDSLLDWSKYKTQELALILNQQTDTYEYYPYSTDPSAERFGTKKLWWKNMDTTWDEIYHHTWDMYEFHGEFLGGFRIYSPEIGDGIQIDDWPVFYFGDESPSIAPLDLQEAVDQLVASDNPGIQKFDYRVYQGPASPPYIWATGKTAGPDSWRFVTYHPISSPGSISGDVYTWTYPTWVLEQNQLQDLLATYPTINEDMLFLDAPLNDLVSDAVADITYWQDQQFIKTEPPSVNFPLGEHRGHLPSFNGSGAFTTNNVRVFNKDFEAPIGAPLFFVHNHSDIPGKTDVRWVVTNTITGEVYIDVQNYFLILTFLEEAVYDLECYLVDTHGNESYVKKSGFIKISDKASFAKPVPA